MKKQNRISEKADSAESGAQSKSPRGELNRSSYFCGDNMAEFVAGIGDEISSFETGYAEVQYLCRKGADYVLAVEFTEVCDTTGKWNRSEVRPGTPEEFRRTGFLWLGITREEAVRWLDDNIIDNLIPKEFLSEFRRIKKGAGEAKQATSIDRELLCAVLGLNAKADDDMINAAMGKAVWR